MSPARPGSSSRSRELVAELNARGIDTLVDGAHAPGMVPVDVDGSGPPTGRATATSGCAGRRARPCCGSARTGATGSTRSSCPTAPTPPLADRTRFRHEFDWVGTADPTGFLTLPAAIDWMAAQAPAAAGRRSWPSNHALALAGRDRLCAALGLEPPAPDAMLGSMAALPLPWIAADDAAADARPRRARDRGSDPGPGRCLAGARRPRRTASARRVLVRISAQRYNEPADYERLAAALAPDPVDRPGPPVADERPHRRARRATGTGLVSPVRNGVRRPAGRSPPSGPERRPA